MKNIIEIITEIVEEAFGKAGYDTEYGKVTFSNRQDLCQFQCNGAMAAAKVYKENPFVIGSKVADVLKSISDIYEVAVIKPGFININLNNSYISDYLGEMNRSEKIGFELKGPTKKVVVDYGGPNIAKPLHVGHLRSAVIGESIKRINKFVGNTVVGDIHLGDWGLQIGIVIEELRTRKPDLIYFDGQYTGDYPEVAPFSISELSDIYPTGSKKSKEDPEFMKKAQQTTAALQDGNQGFQQIWQHINAVSIGDLKTNYGKLNIEFDLWNGESHSQVAIPTIIEILKAKNLMEESQGALIVQVEKPDDKRPMPPFIVLKSDGASLYSTTDLATIYQRVQVGVDEIIYVVDKRQELHFEQVFRCAKMSGIAPEDLELNFIGFGTMNGKDGKPFKTRDGGVMKLEDLIQMLETTVEEKVLKDKSAYTVEELKEIPIGVGLAALKYGDLINQASKDYIFDLEKFTKFEGKTGPYVQYSLVRIKSILKKAGAFEANIQEAHSKTEESISIKLLEFNSIIEMAYKDKMPNKICEYAFDLSNLFNRFYHESYILTEENEGKKNSWLTLLTLLSKALETCLDLLGISVLDKM